LFEVRSVDENGAAARSGIRAGDVIVSVNGEELQDYIDYVYFCAKKRLRITVKRDGKLKKLRVVKYANEDLGLEFTEPLLGEKRVCSNKCIFCFVDRLPKGMRESLYVKDEDWRYSLIMGNYLTLSSMPDAEIGRIIRRKASPLYISVHTVDEELRRGMLGNARSRPIKPILKKFAAHNIKFHAQAVICPGINDKDKLEETYSFLKRLYPAALSLAVVPVGLTAHRRGCKDIPPVTGEGAKEIIERVENWQKECLNYIRTRFVFAADELYIKAGLPLPPAENYESYAQIENGVGMMRKFIDEARCALGDMVCSGAKISVATGKDAYPFIKKITDKIKGRDVAVHMVENTTFGGGVTVSGLLAGRDYLRALNGKDLGETLLIPSDSLRDGVFLDDMELKSLEEKLGVRIIPVSDGFQFAERLRGGER